MSDNEVQFGSVGSEQQPCNGNTYNSHQNYLMPSIMSTHDMRSSNFHQHSSSSSDQHPRMTTQTQRNPYLYQQQTHNNHAMSVYSQSGWTREQFSHSQQHSTQPNLYQSTNPDFQQQILHQQYFSPSHQMNDANQRARAHADAFHQAQANHRAASQARFDAYLYAQARADTYHQTQVYAHQQAQAQAEAEAEAQAQAQAYRQAQAQAQALSQAYHQAQAHAQAQSQAYHQAQAQAQAQSQAYYEAQTQAQAQSLAYQQAQAQAQVQSQAYHQAQAHAQAQSQAYHQAKAYAKAQSRASRQAQARVQALTQSYHQAPAQVQALTHSHNQTPAQGQAQIQASRHSPPPPYTSPCPDLHPNPDSQSDPHQHNGPDSSLQNNQLAISDTEFNQPCQQQDHLELDANANSQSDEPSPVPQPPQPTSSNTISQPEVHVGQKEQIMEVTYGIDNESIDSQTDADDNIQEASQSPQPRETCHFYLRHPSHTDNSPQIDEVDRAPGNIIQVILEDEDGKRIPFRGEMVLLFPTSKNDRQDNLDRVNYYRRRYEEIQNERHFERLNRHVDGEPPRVRPRLEDDVQNTPQRVCTDLELFGGPVSPVDNEENPHIDDHAPTAHDDNSQTNPQTVNDSEISGDPACSDNRQDDEEPFTLLDDNQFDVIETKPDVAHINLDVSNQTDRSENGQDVAETSPVENTPAELHAAADSNMVNGELEKTDEPNHHQNIPEEEKPLIVLPPLCGDQPFVLDDNSKTNVNDGSTTDSQADNSVLDESNELNRPQNILDDENPLRVLTPLDGDQPVALDDNSKTNVNDDATTDSQADNCVLDESDELNHHENVPEEEKPLLVLPPLCGDQPVSLDDNSKTNVSDDATTDSQAANSVLDESDELNHRQNVPEAENRLRVLTPLDGDQPVALDDNSKTNVNDDATTDSQAANSVLDDEFHPLRNILEAEHAFHVLPPCDCDASTAHDDHSQTNPQVGGSDS